VIPGAIDPHTHMEMPFGGTGRFLRRARFGELLPTRQKAAA
jgi:hypothetical protein